MVGIPGWSPGKNRVEGVTLRQSGKSSEALTRTATSNIILHS